MAAPATVDEFLDLVRKSGVADEKRFDACAQKARASLPPNEPAKVAWLLVQEGVITNFQAENILAGKWRRFTIGKYKVLERLGSGGFAQVYLCEHKLMRRRVAVKVLPVAKAKNSSALQRFHREARLAATLDHPNIVHTYDIDEDADLHYIVMEYVDGANLQQIVAKSGALSVPRATYYIHQAALGLQHAHEAGLVHRDIKPGNVLVDREGVVKVLDLGLALNLNSDEELTRKFEDGTLGTADYVSPEQAIDSHAVDIRTDIYSLGVTFYFLLTGKAPFDGMPLAQKLMAHQMKAPPPIARKDMPAKLATVLDKMMAKQADQRHATPGEVADALAPFIQEEIAPPSEAEMPHLSPAALSIGAAIESKPSTPRPQPGSAKRVAGPATPPPPAPKAAAAVATVSAAKSVPAPEIAPWEEAAHDTDNPAAQEDTAPGSNLDLPVDKRPPRSSAKTLVIIGILVAAFVVIPLCLTVSITGVMWIFFPTKEPPPPEAPPTLEVSRDPGRKAYRSITQALRNAKTGATIELHDDSYEENVVIDPTKGPTAITLQAAPGKSEIIWRAGRSNDPTQPILWITKTEDFKLKGKGIVLDGSLAKGNVRDLLMITSHNPNLVVEDLQLKSFARCGVLIMNAAGKPGRPIRLERLWSITQGDEKPTAAIYFDANPQVSSPAKNDNIEIVDGEFRGLAPGAAVVSREDGILGPNVRWPGRNP
jgi:serine/threonine protein kinase